MKAFWVICIGMLVTLSTAAQGEWILWKTTNDDTSVYYRDAQDSDIKELRMKVKINASLSSIMALLNDVDRYKEWVYGCAETRILEKISDTEAYYYNVVDFPWPLSDRDVVGHSKVTQDAATGKVVAKTVAKSDYMDRHEDRIRIEMMQIRWEFMPQSDGSVLLEYYLKSDPGGKLPAWTINLALDRGPLTSMENFKQLLPEYEDTQMSFIQDFGTKRK